ncbi:MAG: nucleoside deaminase [Rhodospirillales bacterium]|nr:nucleoside deaminase [Alphaproteobacteria bacterium]USO04231.1 MAG: nucleoside deaminase [Rhodospirillales bacterium]
MEDDHIYMQAAMEEAKKARLRDEVPIGAVLVDSLSGEIVTRDGNRTIERADPTAHAEILVIREECKKRGVQRIPECDLYVTLEPCAMCAAAISFARIRRLVYGASDPKGGAIEHGPRFFGQPTCHHKIEIAAGVHAGPSGQILKDFFASKR